MKTYVTGDSTCMTGVVYIYDMFGPDFKQTLLGADIIGSTGHVVVMPDFFRGQRFDVSNIPADTEEKMAKLMGSDGVRGRAGKPWKQYKGGQRAGARAEDAVSGRREMGVGRVLLGFVVT
jgi:hypothetical protein